MIGIVDIGSNTIRLSCYKIRTNGDFECVIHKKETAGLAGYVDEKGKMTQEGIEKVIHTLQDFQMLIQYMHLKEVYFFATASIRNTINCKEIVQQIEQQTGYSIQVLSGQEEAICDFEGVNKENKIQNGLVIDIGGGSTEIVSFQNKKVNNAKSYKIGSLSMYKRFVRNILPTKDEVNEIRKYTKKSLVEEKEEKCSSAYGVGGSIRAILRLYNLYYKMEENNRELDCEKVRKLFKIYLNDSQSLLEQMIKVAPERLHTLIPGLSILCTIIKQYDLDKIVVSKNGVREGFLVRHVLEKEKC
ncbi:MAG: phosphatase [Bacillota bacterium]|nr:phosphatase [Bacillota bacterium]